MASVKIGTSHNQNVLNWEKFLAREVLKQMQFSAWMGGSSDAGIRIIDDLKRGAGDTVYTSLIMNLDGSGVAGDENLQGQEEDLVTHRQTVTINQLRHAVKTSGAMSNQRAFWTFAEEARVVLQKYGSNIFDFWGANTLAGNTVETDTNKTGMQSASAPTSATGNMRIIYGPASSTTEASLTAIARGFQLGMIDEAIGIAKTSNPALEPLMTPQGRKWICVMHPWQELRLRTDATANRVTWYDYSRSLIEGGGKDMIMNPARGAIGEYNGCLMFSNSRMPTPTAALTKTRRAVFFGAQAASMAFGREGGDKNRWKMVNQLEDYGNRKGIGVATISGMKKNVYNSIDFGVIVLSSYAAP